METASAQELLTKEAESCLPERVLVAIRHLWPYLTNFTANKRPFEHVIEFIIPKFAKCDLDVRHLHGIGFTETDFALSWENVKVTLTYKIYEDTVL